MAIFRRREIEDQAGWVWKRKVKDDVPTPAEVICLFV